MINNVLSQKEVLKKKIVSTQNGAKAPINILENALSKCNQRNIIKYYILSIYLPTRNRKKMSFFKFS